MPRKRKTPVRDRQQETAEKVARVIGAYALRGELWAFRAIADALEGTVDGSPPPIDADALVEAGLGAEEIIRKIRRAYTGVRTKRA
ncbi:MAG: hypothetical protein ABSA59_24570 [Terriglobia bacterium]|jgi:hypothetical protein